MSTQPKTIPCKGFRGIDYNERDRERSLQVAQYILEQDVSTSGEVRRNLEAFVERRRYRVPSEIASILREFEHQCP